MELTLKTLPQPVVSFHYSKFVSTIFSLKFINKSCNFHIFPTFSSWRLTPAKRTVIHIMRVNEGSGFSGCKFTQRFNLFTSLCLMIRGTLCLFSKTFDPTAVNEKKAHLCLSAGNSAHKIQLNAGSLCDSNAKTRGRGSVSTLHALPETAVSVTVAATIAVAAATFFGRKTNTSDLAEAPTKTCEDCGGSGICSECNGEGFMLKKMSDESAEKARLLAKNMASRYTAGLPKKWSYCTKCSSGRSCSTCGGSGKLSS